MSDRVVGMRARRAQQEKEQAAEAAEVEAIDVEIATPIAPVSLADIRPMDLVVCPTCSVAVSLHAVAKLDERDGARGVFCPHCGQQLFDEETWLDHVGDRRVYDREQRELAGVSADS